MSAPEAFLLRFFGPGNDFWPGMAPNHPAATNLTSFLQALAHPGECPVILPRRHLAGLPDDIYVIGWDTAHAGRIRALLEASVAHHWAPFDGRVAHLDPVDSIEKAVLDFVGPDTTFVLKPPNPQALVNAIRALRRLVDTLAGRPLRTPTRARPVGRMLREFDLALSTGAVAVSAALLREIESLGGISHENIAYLRVRRLSRLGREAELLSDGSLPSLVYTEPPFLVREAVLGAWARTRVLPVLEADGMPAAFAAFEGAAPDIALLVDKSLLRTEDNDVAAVCAIVALAREDHGLAKAFAADRSLPAALFESIGEIPKPVSDPGQEPELEPEREAGPASWLEWASSLAAGDHAALDVDTIESWVPAWSVDKELATAIDALPDLAEDSLLSGVAAFLETDEPEHAAVHTAASLITRYLLSERFDPSDLAALCTLLQIFVRGAPTAARYEDVLGNIREYSSQWVSVLNAVRVIDIADAAACGPATSSERESFVATLLGPLSQQRARLPSSMRGLAALVAADLALGLSWDAQSEDSEALTESAFTAELEPKVLLYSLDTGTLARTRAAIAQQWPRAEVQVCADKVGNPGLKQHARNADVIVLATRRAAHAATGFIAASAGKSALIAYADGSGSASMLRAVEAAIQDWAG